MARIEETISTKIGSIWHTGAAKRGGTIYIVDKDYNEEEAKEAVRTAKRILREAGFAANVDYYWCHTGDKPLRMYIRTTKKQEEANSRLDQEEE